MYAIIETGGKQYKVEEGTQLQVEKLEAQAGDSVTFDRVLFVQEDGNVKVGNPTIDGAHVNAKVVDHGKGEKIVIFKYKPKTNYRLKQGHRQPFTEVVIEKIQA